MSLLEVIEEEFKILVVWGICIDIIFVYYLYKFIVIYESYYMI